MQSAINSKRVKYVMEDSPNHIRLHLKKLRERKDSSCDLDLVLGDGTIESVHKVVAVAYSETISELCSGRCLILTSFNPEGVRNIVAWIYNGEVDLPVSDLADNLIICHHLGMKYLHRQLEQTVRRMPKNDDAILLALKIATNHATGVSDDTIRQCLSAVCDRYEISDSESLQKLNVDTILALVSGDCSQDKKMRLVNTALNWLRLPDNVVYCDEVIAATCVKELRPTELEQFKETLTEAMGNEVTRGLAGVEMKLNVTVEAREKKDDVTGETAVERNFESTDDGLSDAYDDVILESEQELGAAALGRLIESINNLVAKLTGLDANRSINFLINNGVVQVGNVVLVAGNNNQIAANNGHVNLHAEGADAPAGPAPPM